MGNVVYCWLWPQDTFDRMHAILELPVFFLLFSIEASQIFYGGGHGRMNYKDTEPYMSDFL